MTLLSLWQVHKHGFHIWWIHDIFKTFMRGYVSKCLETTRSWNFQVPLMLFKYYLWVRNLPPPVELDLLQYKITKWLVCSVLSCDIWFWLFSPCSFSSFKGREVGNEKLIGILDLQQLSYKNVDARGLITGFQFLQVRSSLVFKMDS